VTTIEMNEDPHEKGGAIRKDSRKEQLRKRSSSSGRVRTDGPDDVPDHNFVRYVPNATYEYGGRHSRGGDVSAAAAAAAAKKWKEDKVPKMKAGGSATSQEDSDEPLLREARDRGGVIVGNRTAEEEEEEVFVHGGRHYHRPQRPENRYQQQQHHTGPGRSLSPSSAGSADQSSSKPLQQLQVII
jgi:hypothetical protein